MTNTKEYAQGIVSVHAIASYNGKRGFVFIKDPKRPEGYSWPGGFFKPTGNLLRDVRNVFTAETGIPINGEDYARLKHIVYSRTRVNNRWVANHNFFASVDNNPNFWKKPIDEKFEVVLVDPDSLRVNPYSPKIVETVFGPKRVGDFRWAINDGPFLARRVSLDTSRDGRYFSEIPVAKVYLDGSFSTRAPAGLAMNVASCSIIHDYQGKSGHVFIKNMDSPHLAVVGGKVESSALNIDVISAAVQEGSEEIGVRLQPLSIIGVALTPLDWVKKDAQMYEGGITSVLNTRFLVRPLNPEQMDDAIKHPARYISEPDKIKGIYFIPDEELDDALKDGMRTPDMARLMDLEFWETPSRRPNLEGIALARTEAGLPSIMEKGADGEIVPETTIFP